MAGLKQIWNALLDALFPRACVLCKQEGDILCASCNATVSVPQFTKQKEHEGINFFAKISYKNKAIQKTLHAWKYKGDREAGKYWKQWIEEGDFPEKNVQWVFVPVPLAREAYAERGFNQAEELASSLAKKHGAQIVNALERLPRKAQAKTTKEDRDKITKENPYKVIKSLQGELPKNICLVDDVATTGSTIVACAEVLRKAGAEQIIACTLAYGNDA